MRNMYPLRSNFNPTLGTNAGLLCRFISMAVAGFDGFGTTCSPVTLKLWCEVIDSPGILIRNPDVFTYFVLKYESG
jgi:hypothetical protein